MEVCERCARGWFSKPLIKKETNFMSHYRAECDRCRHIKPVMYIDNPEEEKKNGIKDKVEDE